MKNVLLIALLLTVSVAGFSQKKKAKTPRPAAVVKATDSGEDTLYHRRAQVSTQDVSQTENSRVVLLNGYALILKQGENVRLEPGDSARMPYFLIGDKPATLQQVEALHAADLENVSIWKREKATAAYGKKAQFGAVILNIVKPKPETSPDKKPGN